MKYIFVLFCCFALNLQDTANEKLAIDQALKDLNQHETDLIKKLEESEKKFIGYHIRLLKDQLKAVKICQRKVMDNGDLRTANVIQTNIEKIQKQIVEYSNPNVVVIITRKPR